MIFEVALPHPRRVGVAQFLRHPSQIRESIRKVWLFHSAPASGIDINTCWSAVVWVPSQSRVAEELGAFETAKCNAVAEAQPAACDTVHSEIW